MLLATLAVLVVTQPARPEAREYRARVSSRAGGRLGAVPPTYLEFAPASGAGLPSLGSFCSIVSGYADTEFCVGGDGIAGAESDVGVTLIGDAASESLTRCPNGPDCSGAPVVRFATTGAIKASTATTYASATAMTACWWGKTGDGQGAVGAQYNMLMSQLTVNSYPTDGWYLLFDRNLFSLQAIFGAGGASTVGGTIYPGVEYLICIAHDGNTASAPSVWVNGANLTNAPAAVGALSATAPISVGAQSGIENYGDTMLTLGAFKAKVDLSSSMAALYAAIANEPPKALVRGSPSIALTYTRTGSMFCTKADNTGSILPANRPCTSQNGILVEAAATNLVVRSQELENAAWSDTAGSTTVTANHALSPDGTKTAERIVFPASTSQRGQTVTAADATYTFSFYAKGTSGSGSVSAYMEAGATACSYTNTAWTRCTRTVATSGGSFVVAVTNDAAADADDVLVWGAQVEAGSVATSYIPTTSASAARGVTMPYFVDPNPTINPSSFSAALTANIVSAPAVAPTFLRLAGTSYQTDTAGRGLWLFSNSSSGADYRAYSLTNAGVAGGAGNSIITPGSPFRVVAYNNGSTLNFSMGATTAPPAVFTPGAFEAVKYIDIGNQQGTPTICAVGGRLSRICLDPRPSRCR